MRIALLGDHSSHPSHRELDALVPRLAIGLGVEARWVATDSGEDVTAYDAVWLVPGSPYADDAAVLAALTDVREGGIPFLGTCGGLQYAVVEFARNVVGLRATHAESDGVDDDNVVAALACSLQGEQRLVTPISGTRFAGWVAGAVRRHPLLLLRPDGRRGARPGGGRRGGRRDGARRRRGGAGVPRPSVLRRQPLPAPHRSARRASPSTRCSAPSWRRARVGPWVGSGQSRLVRRPGR